MMFIGMPLFSFLFRLVYFPVEEKYMPIRPSDAFVSMALCGWAMTLTLLVAVALWILTSILIALIGLGLTSFVTLCLTRIIGKLVLDYALTCELETMNE